MKLKNVKVLIVDDESMIRDLVSEVLEEDGASVMEASNGKEALEMIGKHDFNVVLTDVRMPVCSGIDLLNSVRELKGKVPEVILMSAFMDVSEKDARDLGARALFMKPGKIEEIKDLILEVLG